MSRRDSRERDYDGYERGSDRGGYERGSGEPRRVSLLVRNLPHDARPDEIRSLFERYGEIRDIYMPRDYYTQRPKGFGFVEFRDKRDAEECLYKLDRSLFQGREISVVMSKESRKTPREMLKRENEETYRPRRGGGRSRSRSRGRTGGSRHRSRSRQRSYSRSRSPVRRRSPSRSRSASPRKSRRDDRDRSRSRDERRPKDEEDDREERRDNGRDRKHDPVEDDGDERGREDDQDEKGKGDDDEQGARDEEDN